MFEVSVVICSHNPREDFLKRVINALINQTLKKDLWELLVIDNASSKPLAFDVKELPCFRIIREEKVGLIFARLTGIKESAGKLIIFVDDDNILDNNYIEQALIISKLFPNLGCVGAGKIEPEFERPISDELRPYQGMLALRNVATDMWSNIMEDKFIPWGAGLVVKHEVAIEYCNKMCSSKVRHILGRNDDALLSGEDIEFSWIACQMGLGKGLFKNLHVTHLIDRRRVQLDYMLRLAEGHEFSNTILDYLHDSVNNRQRVYMSSIKDVLDAVFQFKLFSALVHVDRICSFNKKSKVDKLIIKAKQKGFGKAEKFIKTIQTK